ncbi:MAG: MBL fold metallo-hydrolase [Prevotella sp.]|nr:MBL fold metallo-hydrolase [Prevotella sp.]MCI2079707.1 MBL fold metallo-hydrolase [Prevotella sp.]MCI2101438.1 MBL fold metallo-hydrolase [Prevotella sp.]
MKRSLVFVLLVPFLFVVRMSAQIPQWKKGYLDIHTIFTGHGNSQYIVFPDGTTLMIDAGDHRTDPYNRKYAPMRCSPIYPDSTFTAASAIANYIRQAQSGQHEVIDYFLITHFHSDHYGEANPVFPMSPQGNYILNGLTELAAYIPIHTIVDRGYPQYAFPVDMRHRVNDDGSPKDPSFHNYLQFIQYQMEKKGLKVEKFDVGSDRQFVPLGTWDKTYPSFSVRNIKAGNIMWTGKGRRTKVLFSKDDLMGNSNVFNENPLSCAIVIRYGSFVYYAGGDNTGLYDQDHKRWFDVETPMAKVIGKVSAMSLNHHGNRDATNLNFLNALDPKVVIMQTWSSDHPGQEVGQRLISPNVGTRHRDVYMTRLDPLTGLGIGPWFEKDLKGKLGHYLLRVYPDSSYEVYTLDCAKKEISVLAQSERYQAQ